MFLIILKPYPYQHYHQLRKRDEMLVIFKKMFKGKGIRLNSDEYAEKYKEFNEIKKKLYLE